MQKKEDLEIHETLIYLKAKKKIDLIKSTISLKSKEETYQEIRSLLVLYLNSILGEKNFMTEEETLKKLKNFNIDKNALEMAENTFKKVIQIEYNNKDYSAEELYGIIINCEEIIEEINIQRKAYHQSLKDRVSETPKSKTISQFESNLKTLKSRYMKKGDIPNELVTQLVEYYNYLPDANKKSYSKDFHYYCRVLPELKILLSELAAANERYERHEITVSINRIFAKLDDEEKDDLFPKIMNFLKLNEERIDLLLIYGYSLIFGKKNEKAILAYKAMFECFGSLTPEKKKYYQPILLRFLAATNVHKSFAK